MLPTIIRGLSILSVATALSSCATIKTAVNRDLQYPGGVAGSIYDKYYVVDASTNKQHQILRAALTLAIFSRVGTANIHSGKEATAFIAYLQQATDDINRLAGDVYVSTPITTAKPDETCAAADIDSTSGCMPVLFESDVPAVERSLVNVAIAGLPRQEASQFVQSFREKDFGGSLREAIRLAFASLDSLHRGAAVHRSNVELFAIALAAGGSDCQSSPNGPDCGNQISTITQALCFLGADEAGGIACTDKSFDPPKKGSPDYQQQTQAYRTQLKNRAIDRKFFGPVFVMIQTSCLALPLDIDLQNGDPSKSVGALRDARNNDCEKLKFAPVAHKLLEPIPPTNAADAGSPPIALTGSAAGAPIAQH